MENHLPLITIVTVCRNVEYTLEATIQSVLAQSYPHTEYIIVDGGSTDGTVDIIRRYAKQLTCWTSSQDNGVYDAMNKGLAMASGDYIYFIGADDWLADSAVLEKVSKVLDQSSDIDILCGRVLVVDRKLGLCRLVGGTLTREQVFCGCMTPHQGMFTRTQLLREQRFSSEYKVAADFAFLLRSFLENKNIVFSEACIAYYSCYGMSSTSGLWIKEYTAILEKYLPQDVP
ncbi:MAG TPA: glycosyltransferase family 2 protein, partial [Prolixibacteraceae bacterium]